MIAVQTGPDLGDRFDDMQITLGGVLREPSQPSVEIVALIVAAHPRVERDGGRQLIHGRIDKDRPARRLPPRHRHRIVFHPAPGGLIRNPLPSCPLDQLHLARLAYERTFGYTWLPVTELGARVSSDTEVAPAEPGEGADAVRQGICKNGASLVRAVNSYCVRFARSAKSIRTIASLLCYALLLVPAPASAEFVTSIPWKNLSRQSPVFITASSTFINTDGTVRCA